RGALADVSDKLLLQFVDNLNSLIASQPVTASNSTTPSASDSSAMDTAVETAPPTPGVRKIEQTHDVAPLDLLDTAGSTIVKRLVPVALVVAAVVAALVIFR
ncbi:MAG: hypothetical protein ACO3RN_05680, partial [Ilumatobacteraceae bacterium]